MPYLLNLIVVIFCMPCSHPTELEGDTSVSSLKHNSQSFQRMLSRILNHSAYIVNLSRSGMVIMSGRNCAIEERVFILKYKEDSITIRNSLTVIEENEIWGREILINKKADRRRVKNKDFGGSSLKIRPLYYHMDGGFPNNIPEICEVIQCRYILDY